VAHSQMPTERGHTAANVPPPLGISSGIRRSARGKGGTPSDSESARRAAGVGGGAVGGGRGARGAGAVGRPQPTATRGAARRTASASIRGAPPAATLGGGAGCRGARNLKILGDGLGGGVSVSEKNGASIRMPWAQEHRKENALRPAHKIGRIKKKRTTARGRRASGGGRGAGGRPLPRAHCPAGERGARRFPWWREEGAMMVVKCDNARKSGGPRSEHE